MIHYIYGTLSLCMYSHDCASLYNTGTASAPKPCALPRSHRDALHTAPSRNGLCTCVHDPVAAAAHQATEVPRAPHKPTPSSRWLQSSLVAESRKSGCWLTIARRGARPLAAAARACWCGPASRCTGHAWLAERAQCVGRPVVTATCVRA
jgi:hypothetical protein